MVFLSIPGRNRLSRSIQVGVLLASSAVAAGCAVEAEAEDVGAAEQAALNPNALNPNAMNPAALSAIQAPDGDLSRQFVRYAVSCAFRSDQSFNFSWTDASGVAHAESYPGLLGLAPSWATQPLDPAGQQWVSACLASRVNAKGVSVMLSSRGTHPALATTSAERWAYQTREAVFFGNLFDGTQKVYACYDPLSMLPSQMANRVCAQPDLLTLDLGVLSTGYACGPIQVLGPCYQVLGLLTLGVCDAQDPVARYFYGCSAPNSAADVPSITTFLAGGIPW